MIVLVIATSQLALLGLYAQLAASLPIPVEERETMILPSEPAIKPELSEELQPIERRRHVPIANRVVRWYDTTLGHCRQFCRMTKVRFDHGQCILVGNRWIKRQQAIVIKKHEEAEASEAVAAA